MHVVLRTKKLYFVSGKCVRKISSVACVFGSIKIDYAAYPKSLISRINENYMFFGSFMFLFCLVFAMSLCASVYMCFVVTFWERAYLLALVCGVYCEFVTFPLVSWDRCGT